MAAETRAPGVPFLAMSASVLMASGACLRASSWMLLAALGGYEVGGRQISVWPCIQWAFDLSGIVAFAGTQYAMPWFTCTTKSPGSSSTKLSMAVLGALATERGCGASCRRSPPPGWPSASPRAG